MAVLQFEIDRSAVTRSFDRESYSKDNSGSALKNLITQTWKDTLENGGTMVLVVSEETITLVQREDSSSFEDDARAALKDTANG